MNQSISKRLYLARIAANLTQAELAEKCGVSIPTIQSIENRLETAKVKTLLIYCKEVGLSITLTSIEGDKTEI